MRTAISLAEVPRPASVESEVFNTIDARQKLQAAIESDAQRRESDEVEFAKGLARDISGEETVNVDGLVQRHAAGKVAAERARQRVEALENILAILNTRFEQLGKDHPDEVNAALSKKITGLEKQLSGNEDAGKDLEAQIRTLKAEQRKPKAAARKSSATSKRK
jgi:hypothetical protein